MDPFTKDVIHIIKTIPFGKVMTYGQIAFMAHKPFAARQVAWILHAMSLKESLPWHRVINAKGQISLGGEMGLIQQSRLIDEGVQIINKRINLSIYGYQPEREGEDNED